MRRPALILAGLLLLAGCLRASFALTCGPYPMSYTDCQPARPVAAEQAPRR